MWGRGEFELGGVEEGETVVGKYCMREIPDSIHPFSQF